MNEDIKIIPDNDSTEINTPPQVANTGETIIPSNLPADATNEKVEVANLPANNNIEVTPQATEVASVDLTPLQSEVTQTETISQTPITPTPV